MAANPNGADTTIDKQYLLNLQTTLEDLLTGVNEQIVGQGYISQPLMGSGTLMVPPVTQNLTVTGAGGTSGSFDVAAALNQRLGQMGGTVADELGWLQRVLTDMIGEITTTITSMGNADSLNSESVDTLLSDFQMTISDSSQSPVSSGSGSSSGSPSTSGSGSPSGGSGSTSGSATPNATANA